jgi:hypothetical protein
VGWLEWADDQPDEGSSVGPLSPQLVRFMTQRRALLWAARPPAEEQATMRAKKNGMLRPTLQVGGLCVEELRCAASGIPKHGLGRASPHPAGLVSPPADPSIPRRESRVRCIAKLVPQSAPTSSPSTSQ